MLAFPRPATTAKCARRENRSFGGKRAQGPGPARRSDCKLEPLLPSAALGCCAGRCAPCAPLFDWGCFCPTCSFSACQDCSTLSVLLGRRLSIHLEVGEAPPRARIVTATVEEREERGSLGCPSAPPASSAGSAQPSPAALLRTAVLTSPALPPAPRRNGGGGGWGAGSEEAGV